MLMKKHPFTSYPAAKHQNTANSGYKHMKKKPVDFLDSTKRALALAPAVTLLI